MGSIKPQEKKKQAIESSIELVAHKQILKQQNKW
jgi:hypothetical protein